MKILFYLGFYINLFIFFEGMKAAEQLHKATQMLARGEDIDDTLKRLAAQNMAEFDELSKQRTSGAVLHGAKSSFVPPKEPSRLDMLVKEYAGE
jgi:hypothetical protein